MIKNKIGFIDEKYTQPDFYRNIFNNWAAVYIINDTEYHVQIVTDPYDIAQENVIGFEILKQCKTGRFSIKGDKVYTNVKNALKVIQQLKDKESRENMKKYIMAEASNNTYKVVLTNEAGEKTYLNGTYDSFNNADKIAMKEAQQLNAEYICNS